MASETDTTATRIRVRRATSIDVLAGFSLLLGIVTAIPQLYYVLFGLHLVQIGPNTNPLGEVWYSYILVGDNSYSKVDPGIFAGAVEDAFLLGPLYFATGIGLLQRRGWVIPVGLMTGAMIFYAIVQFFLGDIFGGLTSVTNPWSYWLSNLPYLAYPLWLIPYPPAASRSIPTTREPLSTKYRAAYRHRPCHPLSHATTRTDKMWSNLRHVL